jgi:uncharacterized protein (DUF433 family)
MKTAVPHIEVDSDHCGGKPCVAGTRIRVWDVHVWHDLEGRRPEEIAAAFPQLTLADVHAALAYYLDHRSEIEEQMVDSKRRVADLEAAQGPTRFTRLRDAMMGSTDASIPSG